MKRLLFIGLCTLSLVACKSTEDELVITNGGNRCYCSVDGTTLAPGMTASFNRNSVNAGCADHDYNVRYERGDHVWRCDEE